MATSTATTDPLSGTASATIFATIGGIT
jgi:hypothetical protein